MNVPIQMEIVSEISNHEGGISINRLVQKMQYKVSRVTLLKELRRLIENGYVLVKSDPSHKQRKLLQLGEEVRRVAEEIKALELDILGDPLQNLSQAIRAYIEKLQKIRDGWIKEFARMRMRHNLNKMLEIVEEVK
ncbi:MAG: hypothetical protein QW083_02785 [Methanomassiliicoccales archaeon]